MLKPNCYQSMSIEFCYLSRFQRWLSAKISSAISCQSRHCDLLSGVVFLVLCGLYSPTVAAQISGDITIVTNRGDLIDNGSYQRWIAEFKKQYPQVDKVTLKRSDNYEVESVAMFQLREYGDVTLVPENLPKDLYPNYFVPLNDLGLKNHMYFNDAWSFEGSDYAYTQGVSVEGLVYNKTVFARHNLTVPTSRTQLFELAAKLDSLGITPLTMNVGAAWPLQQWDKAPVAIAKDGDYYDTLLSTRSPFSSSSPYGQSLAIAHRFLKNGWVEDNIIEDGWNKSKSNFVEAKTAMFYLGSWVVPQLMDLGMSAQNIGFAPFPFTDEAKTTGLINKDWGIAVSKYSDNPETAKAWITFLFTQSDYADLAGFIPTDKRRESNLLQMQEFQSFNPTLIQAQSPSHRFIRITNMAGIDFMRGTYIRDILLSSDFERALRYWNNKWNLALANQNKILPEVANH